VFTSRGRPKAVLISVADYTRLQQADQGLSGRSTWLAQAQALAERIRQRRGDQDIDVDGLIEADQIEREARHE